jgi:hypothetical protein
MNLKSRIDKICEKLLNLSDFKIAMIKKMEENSESYLREIDDSIEMLKNNNKLNRNQVNIPNDANKNVNHSSVNLKKNGEQDNKKVIKKSKKINVA